MCGLDFSGTAYRAIFFILLGGIIMKAIIFTLVIFSGDIKSPNLSTFAPYDTRYDCMNAAEFMRDKEGIISAHCTQVILPQERRR